MADNVEVVVGDKIKVFYKSNTIYEAKVIKVKDPVERQSLIADTWQAKRQRMKEDGIFFKPNLKQSATHSFRFYSIDML